MAKISVVNRNEKRKRMAEGQEARREELRAQMKDPNLSYAEKMAVRDSLNKMSKNGAKIRVVNRCEFTGRGKGVYRKFKICRNVFREMASRGALPGVTKSSW